MSVSNVFNSFEFSRSVILIYIAFMIAVLERQVRENYENQLNDSTVDKSKYSLILFGRETNFQLV